MRSEGGQIECHGKGGKILGGQTVFLFSLSISVFTCLSAEVYHLHSRGHPSNNIDFTIFILNQNKPMEGISVFILVRLPPRQKI